MIAVANIEHVLPRDLRVGDIVRVTMTSGSETTEVDSAITYVGAERRLGGTRYIFTVEADDEPRTVSPRSRVARLIAP